VTVRLFAGAAEAFGSGETELEDVPDLAALVNDLAALVNELSSDDGEIRRVLGKCSFFVDGEHQRDLKTALADGSRVDVLPPFAGG